MNLDGTPMRAVSTFSPVEPWKKLGQEWTTADPIRRMQEQYPAPPKVIFVSNNEVARVRWHQLETE
jgi:hypothetical protein